ncbi:MAG TPA: hydantoinase/oxoprolinase family protein [Candidatus Limnocylindria bacterium]|nr:hydantoinase/oxoprolinase family protein [Candidatus Limnocylindria bacterium]
MARGGYRIGIDVGGTFTDVVLVHDGRLTIDKDPTTPRDQSEGVLGGIRQLAARLGGTLSDLLGKTSTVVHGTTTADNTMIEMSGAVTGLVTSEGHRDEIEIRRGYKEDIWDPALPPPRPICPRRQRYGVPERLDFEGNVIVPLDAASCPAATSRRRPSWNWHHRYLVGLPMVDVQTVGAGGGSIARVESGALKVGPRSAGAEPGPACYGRGGTEPTVTDANVVLGFLNPERFCGGTMRLDADGAAAAIRERIAKPLGLSVTAAADGILRIVNANMANAVRKASAQKGIDPRPLAMSATAMTIAAPATTRRGVTGSPSTS